MKLKINEEYKKLCPPLNKDEYDGLKESILKAGIRTELHVLGDGTILSGHTRFEIAQELDIKDIPYKIVKIEKELDRKLYVIDDNLSRRHFSTAQKCALGFTIEHLLGKDAKIKQEMTIPKKGQEGFQRVNDKHVTPELRAHDKDKHAQETTQKVAERVGVGRVIYGQAKRVKRENPKLWEKVEKGEVSVSGAEKIVSDKHREPNEIIIRDLKGELHTLGNTKGIVLRIPADDLETKELCIEMLKNAIKLLSETLGLIVNE